MMGKQNESWKSRASLDDGSCSSLEIEKRSSAALPITSSLYHISFVVPTFQRFRVVVEEEQLAHCGQKRLRNGKPSITLGKNQT